VQSVKQKLTKSSGTMAFVTLEDLFGSMELLVFPNVYSRSHTLLREGQIILAEGRISLTEEKDTKLVCDRIDPPPLPGQALSSGESPQQPKKHSSRPGLYLKVPGKDSREYRKAMQYIAIFDGPTELYLYFQDTGKLVRAPAVYRVDANPVLVRELKRLLGSENVVLTE